MRASAAGRSLAWSPSAAVESPAGALGARRRERGPGATGGAARGLSLATSHDRVAESTKGRAPAVLCGAEARPALRDRYSVPGRGANES